MALLLEQTVRRWAEGRSPRAVRKLLLRVLEAIDD